ncbi:MAG: SDR family oxidoreductase [Desulfobacteraceae bacterium]|nr:SDR family oxidoreductase [Desulfobacteraceae bacterium]MBC2756253.1 SDR family oxidoreductase [Desulfobacteraceae bacterium]
MFDGKKIIITGGSSGVGKSLSQRLIKKGARLALVARDEKKLSAVKKELLNLGLEGQTIEVYPCDVADSKAVEKTFKYISKQMEAPDILINSAGILREGYFENQSIETFREVMDINFFGTLHCIQSALPYFKSNGGGRIVNISSVAGLMGVFGYSAYCASKHALTGLTGSLRAELKHQNIAVHIVYPPEFDSPMVDEINSYRTEENKIMAQAIPILTADKVADEIIKGIEKNRFEIIPGIATRIVTRFEKLLPFMGRAVVDFQINRVYKGPKN